MRGYIFTPHELDAIEEFLRTGKRNPTVNKLIHNIKHNERILLDVRILIALMRMTNKIKRAKGRGGLPGRPSKLVEV